MFITLNFYLIQFTDKWHGYVFVFISHVIHLQQCLSKNKKILHTAEYNLHHNQEKVLQGESDYSYIPQIFMH